MRKAFLIFATMLVFTGGCALEVANPPPEEPFCYSRNTPLLSCGCWGFTVHGTEHFESACCSGYSVDLLCNGYCSGGGYPWANVCE